MMNTGHVTALDKLYRHMAWANQHVLESLRELTGEQLTLRAPGSDWSVAEIAEHLARSANFYAWRLDGGSLAKDVVVPRDSDGVAALAALCGEADARLRAAARIPEGVLTYVREDRVVQRARSTILAQAIHHATEHRAQIADTLAAHEVHRVLLDDLDVWAFADAEGLGE